MTALVVVIEPDQAQAAALAGIVQRQPGAELVIGASGTAALAALGDRVPDLILTPALLPARDEAAIAERLRELGPRASHTHTVTVPRLGTTEVTQERAGLLGRFRRGRPAPAAEVCSPELFAQQIAEYLQRAAAERRPSVIDMLESTDSYEPLHASEPLDLVDPVVGPQAEAVAQPFNLADRLQASTVDEPGASPVEVATGDVAVALAVGPSVAAIDEFVGEYVPARLAPTDQPVENLESAQVASIDEPVGIIVPVQMAAGDEPIDAGVPWQVASVQAPLDTVAPLHVAASDEAVHLAPPKVQMVEEPANIVPALPGAAVDEPADLDVPPPVATIDHPTDLAILPQAVVFEEPAELVAPLQLATVDVPIDVSVPLQVATLEEPTDTVLWTEPIERDEPNVSNDPHDPNVPNELNVSSDPNDSNDPNDPSDLLVPSAVLAALDGDPDAAFVISAMELDDQELTALLEDLSKPAAPPPVAATPPLPVVPARPPRVVAAPAPPVVAGAPPPRPAKRTRADKRRPQPVQDEWGLFDPAQCGFAALLAKLDQVTDDDDVKPQGTSVRVVSIS